jgi:hypothetical protein
MTGNGTKGRIMPALPGRMKKLNWIDDEARHSRSSLVSLEDPNAHRFFCFECNPRAFNSK